MDPLTSIITASVAGAAAGFNPTVAQPVKNGYAALKTLVQRTFNQVNVNLPEQQPAAESWQGVIKEDVARTDAAPNPERRRMAKAFLDIVQRQVLDVAGALGVELKKRAEPPPSPSTSSPPGPA
jgi:hypothetical protein